MKLRFWKTLLLVILVSGSAVAQENLDEISSAKEEAQWIASWGPESVDILVAKNLTLVRCADCGYLILTDPTARKIIIEAALRGHKPRTIFVDKYYPYLEASKLPDHIGIYERNQALLKLDGRMVSDLDGGLERRHLTPAWVSIGGAPNPPSFGTGSSDGVDPQCKGTKVPILVHNIHGKKAVRGKGMNYPIFNVNGQIPGEKANTWSKTVALGDLDKVSGEDLSGPDYELLLNGDNLYARIQDQRHVRPYILVGKKGFFPHIDGYDITFDPRYTLTAWKIQYEKGCTDPTLVLSIKGLDAEQKRIEQSSHL